MSTLLARENLKEEYDYVFNTVALKRDVLLKSMKKKAGIAKGIEQSFSDAVGLSQTEFLIGSGTIEREVKRDKYSEFSDVSYKVLFDQKVFELLANNAANLSESRLHTKLRGGGVQIARQSVDQPCRG